MPEQAFDVRAYTEAKAREIHRQQFFAHMQRFPADDPEYGGTIADWAWDWFAEHPLPVVLQPNTVLIDLLDAIDRAGDVDGIAMGDWLDGPDGDYPGGAVTRARATLR